MGEQVFAFLSSIHLRAELLSHSVTLCLTFCKSVIIAFSLPSLIRSSHALIYSGEENGGLILCGDEVKKGLKSL